MSWISDPPGMPICTYRGREVTFVLRVIKGSDFDVCCTSDSYPSPKYEWHMFDGSKLSGACMTLFNIQTSNSGMYGIIATNVMNLTLGPSMTGFSSISIVVDVLCKLSVFDCSYHFTLLLIYDMFFIINIHIIINGK